MAGRRTTPPTRNIEFRSGGPMAMNLRISQFQFSRLSHGRLLAVLTVMAGALISRSAHGRQPQWPLKTSRTLLTDAQMATARQLCDRDPGAAAQRKKYVDKSAYWVAKTDADLRSVIPDARVPRAFNVSAVGCPQHGKAIYQYGTYPWKLNRDDPFTVTCPVGGERYPDNDFDAYYRSGMNDQSRLKGKFVDDGRGWAGPDGVKYWFVGYACHWNWRNQWLAAVNELSRAYVLTAERQYAHKALVMLDRIAEVYPGMDYKNQSRYSEMTGGSYRGKILNAIWETNTLENLAIAYDMVFDALVGDDPMVIPGRSSQAIRANIEANLLEEGIDAINEKDIHGNFGMHQSALAYAVVVRQNGPSRKWLDDIFDSTTSGIRQIGLDYALYNLVFKDGMPYESSPGYCFSWVGHFVTMADALDQAGIHLYKTPKFKRMFDAPLAMICAGDFTPCIGDSGSIDAGWAGPTASAYEATYRHLNQPDYAWALSKIGGLQSDGIDTYDKVFKAPIVSKAKVAASKYDPRQRTRVLDGYGLAVLNNENDSLAASMYFGIRGGHGHLDRLNLELFAYQKRMAPDLGYPDFMNAFVPGIYSWSKNTISHNTVTVDETPQPGNAPGRVLRLHRGAGVHVVDVDARGTYPQTTEYRRTLALIETGPNDGYLVDVFRVTGGGVHVQSIHGPDAEFRFEAGSLTPPEPRGTLAGKNVEYGQLYDDDVLGKPDYAGGFQGYRGTGYQHFFNWQKQRSGDAPVGHWAVPGEAKLGLRVHVPPQPDQEVIVADAYVSPTKKRDTILKYMLIKRTGENLTSRFVTVWEPYRTTPQITDVQLLEVESGDQRAVVLAIRRGESTDTVLISLDDRELISAGDAIHTDAAVAVVTETQGRVHRLFAAGGKLIEVSRTGTSRGIPLTVTGRIIDADYAAKRVTVQMNQTIENAARLNGMTVRLFNDKRSCVYTIDNPVLTGRILRLTLAGSDVFVGRSKIKSVDAEAKTVDIAADLLYPHAAPGTVLLTDDLSVAAPIESATSVQIKLTADPTLFADHEGEKVWLADFGLDDRVEIEMHLAMSPKPANPQTQKE